MGVLQNFIKTVYILIKLTVYNYDNILLLIRVKYTVST
jgi:hypothetical protein